MKSYQLVPSLATTVHQLKEDKLIPDERKMVLNKLALYVGKKVKQREKASLNFICTHNSRRSHLAQIWAQASAAYYGIPDISCYSGGTEATALNPRAVNAMENAGFEIRTVNDGANPVYEVRFSNEVAPIHSYSKKYDTDENPRSNFAAVMTCSHADQNCPLVAGAEVRFSIPYDDPKDFDGTSEEEAAYRERTLQIGREMLYVFSKIKSITSV